LEQVLFNIFRRLWRLRRQHAVVLLLAATLGFFASFAHSAVREINLGGAEDEIPYRFDAKAGVVAIGDLHGNFAGLLEILLATGLIDSETHWSGGSQHLVLMGDYFAGQPDSRLILDLMMRLEIEAKAAEGGVHPLLGNHELLVLSGDVSKMSAKEKSRFTRYEIDGVKYSDTQTAILNSKYGQWLAQLNQFVVVNNTLFTHAGILPRTIPSGFNLGRLNSFARAWARYWINTAFAPRPPKKTNWIVEGRRSPSWTKAYAVDTEGRDLSGSINSAPRRKKLAQFLGALGLSRMVMGHRPIPNAELILNHDYYGESLIMIDTKITGAVSNAKAKAGHLSAIRISGDGELQGLKFDVTEAGKDMRKVQLNRLKNKCSTLFE